MKRTSVFWLLCAALVLLAATGCGGPAEGPEHKPITIKGSDTMVILAQRWAETYMTENHGSRIQVTGGGSGTGSPR